VYVSRNGRLPVLFAAAERRNRRAGAGALVAPLRSISRACAAADFVSISRACAAADFMAGVNGGGPGV